MDLFQKVDKVFVQFGKFQNQDSYFWISICRILTNFNVIFSIQISIHCSPGFKKALLSKIRVNTNEQRARQGGKLHDCHSDERRSGRVNWQILMVSVSCRYLCICTHIASGYVTKKQERNGYPTSAGQIMTSFSSCLLRTRAFLHKIHPCPFTPLVLSTTDHNPKDFTMSHYSGRESKKEPVRRGQKTTKDEYKLSIF